MPDETAVADPTQEALPVSTEVAEAAATETEAAAEEVTLAETVETPAPTAWANIPDPYDVLDLPDFQPHLERRDRRVRAEADAQVAQQVEERTKTWESSKLYSSLHGFVGTITEKLDGADLDGADKVLGRLEALVQPYQKEWGDTYRQAGILELRDFLLPIMTEGFDRRSRDEWDDFVADPRNNDWKKILAKRDEMVLSKEVEAEVKKQLETARKALSEQLRAEGREGVKPDLATKGVDATINNMEEADRRYALPEGNPDKMGHEEYKAVRARLGVIR